MKEALLYEKLDNNVVQCHLCSHHCKINPNQYGICQIRENKKGILYTHAYGRVVAMQIDPIEKKPLYHLLPNSKSFSIATQGCNFRCDFCQNWQISQKDKETDLARKSIPISPEEIVKKALSSGCKTIAYTYTEPTIYFEYALDACRLAKQKGLYNIFVTNGYMTREALEMISLYLDAANIDLKFFNDTTYSKLCGGHLKPVLETIQLMHSLGIWIEITTLIIPGLNDSNKELNQIAEFIAQIGKEIPWHLSRFHPDYKITNIPATPIDTLYKAQEIAKEAGLYYVYIGNVLEKTTTQCYSCSRVLVKRDAMTVTENVINNSQCPYCSTKIHGIWEKEK